MRINPDYKLRDIAGETIVVKQGTAGADLTCIISLNPSAKLLYETMSGREFSTDDVVDELMKAYHIDKSLAAQDAAKWVEALKQCALISE